ncbi:MAG: hypothetical protein PHW29_04455 [Flavobacterium sp.]|nr:hypothetical protein [Flavobacterium sp.]
MFTEIKNKLNDLNHSTRVAIVGVLLLLIAFETEATVKTFVLAMNVLAYWFLSVIIVKGVFKIKNYIEGKSNDEKN